MEFYLSFADLFERLPNKIAVSFIPVFLFTILAEALVIQARHGSSRGKIPEFRPCSRLGIC
jgi:hypothetical protein